MMLRVSGDVTLLACKLHRFRENEPTPVMNTTHSTFPDAKLSQLCTTFVIFSFFNNHIKGETAGPGGEGRGTDGILDLVDK